MGSRQRRRELDSGAGQLLGRRGHRVWRARVARPLELVARLVVLLQLVGGAQGRVDLVGGVEGGEVDLETRKRAL